MKRLARFVCAAVCAALLVALCLSSYAAGSANLERLGTLGIFGLKDNGTSLEKKDRPITRAELFKIVCLIRNGGQKAMPAVYADVARYGAFFDAHKIRESDLPYAGYCVANGLAAADANGKLRPDEYATYTDCFTVLLRLLGYPVCYILPANYPSADAWKAELDNICRREGLVSGEDLDPDKSVTLAQLAGMLCAALDMSTYRYDMLQSSVTKSPTGVSLQEKCYGRVETVSAVIVDVQSDGYLLENGLHIKADNPSSKRIGYEISYSSCEKTDYLATVMLPVPGQTPYEEISVKEFVILAVNNSVTVFLGDVTKEYTMPEGGSATILCQQYGSDTATSVFYGDMVNIIKNTRSKYPNAKIRVIIGANGAVQYVKFYN